MRSHSVIGIDFGTESVKAVLLEAGPDGHVKVLGTGTAPSEGLRKGVIMDIEASAKSLASSLEALARFTGVKDADIYAGIGGVGLAFQKSKGLVAISRADGEVSREDIKRAVSTSETNLSRAQNREILHSIPIAYKIDGETLTHDPMGLTGVKLEAETLFITVFAQHFKSLLKTFEEAQKSVENIVALPLAMSKSILNKRDKEVGTMIMDIGSSTTSLILFEENFPYSLEVLPVGSGHVTNDIAVGFQVSIEEAEKLKLNYGIVNMEPMSAKKEKEDLVHGNHSRKKLSNIIEDRLSDILELTEKHLKKVGREGLLPGGVVITGGGANLPGITDFTRDFLKLPARIAETISLEGFKDKIKNPAWAGAVGVALMGLEEKGATGQHLSNRSGIIGRWLRAFLP